MSFRNAGAIFNDPSGHAFLFRKIVGTMYELDLKPPAMSAFSACSHNRPTDLATWHRRLGHVGMGSIKTLLSKHLVDGLDVMSKKIAGMCEDCILANRHAAPLTRL